MADDAKRVNNKLGSEDRSKLDEYLTAVRQVEERTRRADEWLNVAEARRRPLTKPRASSASSAWPRPVRITACSTISWSWRCAPIPPASSPAGSAARRNGGAIPDIGILQTRHGLSHHNGDPEQLRRLTETDTFLVGQFSYFLDQLKEHKESDTPLLDTTQVLWGSGMAYGHSHGNANLPTILAGGKALGYKHGTHVDFNLPKIGKYNVADATRATTRSAPAPSTAMPA